MLTFELIEAELVGYPSPSDRHRQRVWRAKVPGGWIVGRPNADSGMVFVPDPEHKWEGNSLP